MIELFNEEGNLLVSEAVTEVRGATDFEHLQSAGYCEVLIVMHYNIRTSLEGRYHYPRFK